MSPNAGGGGGAAGSQPLSTALHMHGAQINFGDLTPYLTYGRNSIGLNLRILRHRPRISGVTDEAVFKKVLRKKIPFKFIYEKDLQENSSSHKKLYTFFKVKKSKKLTESYIIKSSVFLWRVPS
jgi:hypothetical protein